VTKSGRGAEVTMAPNTTHGCLAPYARVPMRATADRSFYERDYHFDQDVQQPGEARLRRALDLLAPMRGATFLDLGTGVGWAAHLAASEGVALAAGVDFAWRALQLGDEHIPGVARVQADGCRLPLRAASFDAVLSFGSLEHFPDVDLGLRELARILKPGGGAVVVVPNFYVRTGQPVELRLSHGGWRTRFERAGLHITATRADPGPAVLRDHRPVRMGVRAAAKVLALVPRLPYQFIFRLEPAPAS
jgi:SAM-dependent methyltransferase